MKKAITGIVLIAILLITSCTKKASNELGGTWSFKAVNYTATSFATGYSLVTVTNQPTAYSTEYATITVSFYNGLPTQNSGFTGGTFVVSGGNLDSTNQVSIALNIAGNTTRLYRSTGGNGTQTVNVSVSQGKLSITGTGLELANVSALSDTAALNLNLLQP